MNLKFERKAKRQPLTFVGKRSSLTLSIQKLVGAWMLALTLPTIAQYRNVYSIPDGNGHFHTMDQ